MKKKALLLYLVLSLIFVPAGRANAASFSEADIESGTKLNERVYAEVLTGDITNDADVIRVALAQYEERINSGKGLLASEKDQTVDDDSLSITQILDKNIDNNGHILEDIVTTNLLVLDNNNNLVTATSIENGSGQLSEYSIYASMSVSVTNDTSAHKVRFNWFDTTLIYGTSLKAGSLIQDSKYTPEPFFEYADITKQINNPQGNVAYHYSPANTDMVTYITLACGRSCRSVINAGTKSFILAYSLTENNPTGLWETAYN